MSKPKFSALRKPLPLWVCTFLVVLTIASSVVAAGAVASLTVYKPYRLDITLADTQLRPESVVFAGYNATRNQYDRIEVRVRNYYLSGSAQGTVNVSLLAVGGVTIASGTGATGLIAAGITVTVTVTLSWGTGQTIDNAVSGKVSVTEG